PSSSPFCLSLFFFLSRLPPCSTLFPYTTLFRSILCSTRTISLRRSSVNGGTGIRITFPSFDGFSPRPAPWIAFSISPIRLLSHRSEEHTSELQSRENLVCRLLLEKKNNNQHNTY